MNTCRFCGEYVVKQWVEEDGGAKLYMKCTKGHIIRNNMRTTTVGSKVEVVDKYGKPVTKNGRITYQWVTHRMNHVLYYGWELFQDEKWVEMRVCCFCSQITFIDPPYHACSVCRETHKEELARYAEYQKERG